MTNWGYTKLNGPHTWAVEFPIAGSKKQSPIDLSENTCALESFSPLEWKYDFAACNFIVNTGSSWKIQYKGPNSELKGGPLQETYLFEQAHMHWGLTDDRGSEHTVDGKSYAGEVHFVHYNSKYPSFAEAADKPDGLAVLGVMVEVGEENKALKLVTDLVSNIRHKDEICYLPKPWDFSSLLPNVQQYWTYPGSLTTPPCLESVTWIVFKKVQPISHAQLEALRTLRSHIPSESSADEYHGCICDNFRPPMPLCGRAVRFNKC